MYPASPARFLQQRPGDEAAGAVKMTHLSQVHVHTWRPLPGEHVDGRMLQLAGVTASTAPETTHPHRRRRAGRGPSAAGARQGGAVQGLAEGHQRVEDLQDAGLLQLPNGEAAGADPDDGDFGLAAAWASKIESPTVMALV